jgi:hypothetical protein
MLITKVVLMLTCLISFTAMLTLQPPAASQPDATGRPAASPQPPAPSQAKDAAVKELFTNDLPDLPGKEGLMLSVVIRRAQPTRFIATTPTRSSMFSKARSSCR